MPSTDDIERWKQRQRQHAVRQPRQPLDQSEGSQQQRHVGGRREGAGPQVAWSDVAWREVIWRGKR